jgi:hypothetical protein
MVYMASRSDDDRFHPDEILPEATLGVRFERETPVQILIIFALTSGASSTGRKMRQ